MKEQSSLINTTNIKMSYMAESKKKIIEIEQAMLIDKERTEKECLKYQEIIQNSEEEKLNLEKILEEEMQECNELSVI